MAERDLAAIPTQKVPRHAYDRPHDDKDKNVQPVGAHTCQRQERQDCEKREGQVFFHLPNLFRSKRERMPPGMKISAATKMTNLPTGAHPMPIYVAVSDSKTTKDKSADYGPDSGAKSPRIVITKAMSVNCPPRSG